MSYTHILSWLLFISGVMVMLAERGMGVGHRQDFTFHSVPLPMVVFLIRFTRYILPPYSL